MTDHTDQCNCPDCTEARKPDTSFGHIFEAPCHNVLEPDGIACDGVLIFGANSVDAACGKCGARCGRFVAFHENPTSTEARKEAEACNHWIGVGSMPDYGFWLEEKSFGGNKSNLDEKFTFCPKCGEKLI